MAVLQGNLEAVRQHIAAGSDLNQKDPYGSTPLAVAATFGRTDVARALIEAGADLEIKNNDGSTPLHIAAFLCRPEIVGALLEKGADRNARNKYSNTPFDSVYTPFDEVKGIYDQFAAALGPLGLKLDYEQIKSIRPRIAEMLRPRPQDLAAIEYAPLPGGDWKMSTPAEQGLDPRLVAELYYDATAFQTLYGLLVVKNGRLIAERYFNGASVGHKARLASVTKSYTSSLTGIALAQGHLKSVDQKMVEFFPEVADQITDPRKKQITIRQLLQMRGGYPWEETDPALWQGLLSGRYPLLIEGVPLLGDPGTQFNYSNLTSNWLGIILARACKTDLRSYAQENLLTPIGAEAGEWGQDAEGHNNGCANLHMTARDMAKFGLLYLNGGAWQGKQVVPADWVEESLRNYSKDAWITRDRVNHVGVYFRDLGYGYQWWSANVGGHDVDFAWGHGGQLIVLLHDLEMIVVTTTYPFFLQHDDEAWTHEKATVNLVGKFVQFLPKGKTGRPG